MLDRRASAGSNEGVIRVISKSRRLLAALALPLTLVAAACAPKAASTGGGNVQPSSVSSDVASAGPVTLKFLDFEEGADAAYIKKAITGFEQQYPNVKIERTEQSFDQVMSTLNLRLADPNGPDVATINNGWQSMGTLSKAGLILNLDKYAELYGWRDQLSPTMLRQLEFTPDGKKMGEGSLYGTPGARLTTVGLYYNKKLLSDAGVAVPTTYAEFETALATVKAKGETPIALGTQEKTYATNPLFALQSLLGQPKAINDFVYGGSGTTLEQTGLGTAAAKLAEWEKDGYFNTGYNGLDFDGGKKVFTDGKAAFHFDYSGALVGTGADSTKFGRRAAAAAGRRRADQRRRRLRGVRHLGQDQEPRRRRGLPQLPRQPGDERPLGAERLPADPSLHGAGRARHDLRRRGAPAPPR